MFKLKRRRARAPAASFDVSSPLADSEPSTAPPKRPRTALAVEEHTAEAVSSPLTAKAAARQRERESLTRAQQKQQEEEAQKQAALEAAAAAAEGEEQQETPEAVVNNAAVCWLFRLFG